MARRITRTRRRSLRITVSVACNAVEGYVSEAALHDWVCAAIAEYHRFRAGHVGVGASAAITTPGVSLVSTEEEDS